MFRTLYSKLAMVLLGLVCVIGFALFSLVRFSTEMYQQEVAQKLNRELAAHIVSDVRLFHERRINQEALEGLFHNLMIINPSIELYLLDPDGAVLAYSAPPDKVKRQNVGTDAIVRFLAGGGERLILGDDPRHLSRQKVFSAAEIRDGDSLAGYLYVILGGEEYDTVADMLQGSYVLRLSAWGVTAALVIALLSGLVLFALLTRRLRRLSFAMQAFFRESAAMETPMVGASSSTGDEVDRLEQHFEAMAQRIREQMDALRRDHAQRRELIANVSHDLRTPLATLHGYLETLLMKGDGLSEQERGRYLEIAVANSQQLAKLVDELFELAKLDAYESPLHTEPFSVGELVQDVLPKYQLMAEDKRIALDVQFDPELPFVQGDIGMIQRALDNLIENAIRHTPDGGRIAVALEPDHDRVKVSVHDNGCGIPADELPHIFDRFYRLQKSREEGAGHAGLGLAIAKRIVELHGAVIHAESQLNVGTTFSFDLPAFSS